MARVDPWAGKRLSVPTETKEFTDPRQPGQVLDLTLKALEPDEGNYVADILEEMCAMYLKTPEGDRLRENYGIPYVDFPFVDNRPVRLSRTLLQNAATICTMQQPRKDGLPVYEVPELVALSVTWPKAWKEICAWANDLNRQAQDSEGNASGATGETA